jgi:hypothetical protein
MIGQIIKNISNILFFTAVMASGIFFARKNLRLGRGDRRGANHLALFILGLFILIAILKLPYFPVSLLGVIPCVAGLFWILYIALERFVRRRWLILSEWLPETGSQR